MRVAKRFRWEAAHRLPWHNGACRHLHGHSYRMIVAFEGEVDEHGMVMDFKEIKAMVMPIVEQWDHALLVSESDRELLDIARSAGWRFVCFSFETTCENLCEYVAERLCTEHTEALGGAGIRSVTVRIEETESAYAETSKTLHVCGS